MKNRKDGNVRNAARHLALLALVGIWSISATACKDDPVQDYGNKVLDAYDRSGKAAGQASLSNLQRAVEAYRASNGEYPPSLQELEAFSGQSIDPAVFRYDPATGKIEVGP